MLIEAHGSQYSIQPGSTKIYRNIQRVYWQNHMNKDIMKFMVKCPNCHQVKVEHYIPCGMTQNIHVVTLKWKEVNIDFIIRFSLTRRQHVSSQVLVDWMTKSTYFLPVNTINLFEDYERLYIREFIKLTQFLRLLYQIGTLNLLCISRSPFRKVFAPRFFSTQIFTNRQMFRQSRPFKP